MPEFRTLTTLVPRIAAATLLTLVAGTFATNNNATGHVNRLIYLCILVLGLAITAIFLHNQRSASLDTGVALLASIGLVWGIWTIERPGLLAYYWEGFGYRVALAVVVLVLLFATVLRPDMFARRIRVGLGLLVAICCVCDLLGLIRTFDFMPYVNNNLNEINDMLGPLAGKVPDSTYIPQYTALYGWLFLPFKHVLGPTALVGAMAIFFTILDVATVMLAVWLVRRVLGKHGLLLAILLVVPVTYVTSHLAGDQSSIASLFQEIPIRLLAGFIIAALGLKDLVRVYRGDVRPRALVLIGAVCGLVAWNSQDFGLAATVVYGVMILVVSMPAVRRRAFGMWVGGLALGVASYPIFLFAIGSPLDLGFVGAFVKLFGSGLASAAIQVPGPVLIVMPIVICSSAAGWALLRLRRREGILPDALIDEATVTLTFIGTWSAVCLIYYVNRAYAAGQLQTMLLPCGVCVAALLGIAIRTDEFTAVWRSKSDSMTRTTLSTKARMIPLGIFVCLCFSSALLTPDPVRAARNLLEPPAMSGYTTYDLPQVISAVETAQRYVSGKPGGLTYLGESFNFVSLETRVPTNAVLFPFSITAADTGVSQIECRYLRSHHSTWMVLSLDGLAAFGSNACGIYRPVSLRGLAFGQLQELS